MRAQGFGATAMARDTEATNSYSFASGYFTNADGQYSTAMGFNTLRWLSGDPIFEIGIGTGPSSRANAVAVRKNGNVGIGTTVPLDALHANGRVRIGTVEYFEDGGTNEIAVRGDLRPTSDNTYDLGTGSFRWDDVFATIGTVNTSDRRTKENITDLAYGLEEVLALHPVSFNWNDNPSKGRKLGLVAQDVALLIPEVIPGLRGVDANDEDWDGGPEMLGIYYSDLIPVLVRAIQDQQDLLESQAERIRMLEAGGGGG